jgi:hypothetical protein
MIPRLSRWAALVTVTSALVLSACAGGTWSSMPSVPGSSQSASIGPQSGYQPGIAHLNVQPNATCPKRFVACVTVSKTEGVQLIWCYGPKADPCSKSDAAKGKWSGIVCTAAGKTCKKPVKQLTASWSGPFKCKPEDDCKGNFELDTIKPGPGLKETNKYIYKQDSHFCVGTRCEDKYIGLDVGS